MREDYVIDCLLILIPGLFIYEQIARDRTIETLMLHLVPEATYRKREIAGKPDNIVGHVATAAISAELFDDLILLTVKSQRRILAFHCLAPYCHTRERNTVRLYQAEWTKT